MSAAMSCPLPEEGKSLTTRESADLRHRLNNVQQGECFRATTILKQADEIRERVVQVKAEIYGRHTGGSDAASDSDTEPGPDNRGGD
jgi:hypothetical protein